MFKKSGQNNNFTADFLNGFPDGERERVFGNCLLSGFSVSKSKSISNYD